MGWLGKHEISVSFRITAGFCDDSGPVTGETPVITVYDPTNAVVVNAQNMTEIGLGIYYYDYTPSSLGLYKVHTALAAYDLWGYGSFESTDPVEDQVWDATQAGHTTAGSMGANQNLVDDIENDTSAILVDTNEIQGKLPTHNIMGSSDKDDYDTTIDNIYTNVGDPTDALATKSLHGKIGAYAIFAAAGDTVKEELIDIQAGTGGPTIQGV